MSGTFEFYPTSSLHDPAGERLKPAKDKGITMVIDKGLGVRRLEDLLDTASSYLDFIKLGFGTTALYPIHVLKEKIQLAKAHHVPMYPGGTFFEIAFYQNKLKEYLTNARELGFTKIEISDGTIHLNLDQRQYAIQLARSFGFDVITEYGKKLAGSTIEIQSLIETIENDLSAGAQLIIVEGRESGENVGIYDGRGNLRSDFSELIEQLKPYQSYLIWEAPKKNQQVELITRFGPNVHLGNIAPDEIFSVESLRRGLRSDTFFLISGRENI
ncbi:phosphosulfolactate synthase [Ammoniphilus resinae]|uniref:Phosphosulfolactate synthase n=1 Tax=Ammoniphilus resinae TaxID=861532 RepID=A0ABS4GV81_9BACL|nr:phosphosulfolactate synthase [Ammoniphilus resinae]MBP1934170.1 phosphosulfolactate synthase [Ammoniphilus resinae]